MTKTAEERGSMTMNRLKRLTEAQERATKSVRLGKGYRFGRGRISPTTARDIMAGDALPALLKCAEVLPRVLHELEGFIYRYTVDPKHDAPPDYVIAARTALAQLTREE